MDDDLEWVGADLEGTKWSECLSDDAFVITTYQALQRFEVGCSCFSAFLASLCFAHRCAGSGSGKARRRRSISGAATSPILFLADFVCCSSFLSGLRAARRSGGSRFLCAPCVHAPLFFFPFHRRFPHCPVSFSEAHPYRAALLRKWSQEVHEFQPVVAFVCLFSFVPSTPASPRRRSHHSPICSASATRSCARFLPSSPQIVPRLRSWRRGRRRLLLPPLPASLRCLHRRVFLPKKVFGFVLLSNWHV